MGLRAFLLDREGGGTLVMRVQLQGDDVQVHQGSTVIVLCDSRYIKGKLLQHFLVFCLAGSLALKILGSIIYRRVHLRGLLWGAHNHRILSCLLRLDVYVERGHLGEACAPVPDGGNLTGCDIYGRLLVRIVEIRMMVVDCQITPVFYLGQCLIQVVPEAEPRVYYDVSPRMEDRVLAMPILRGEHIDAGGELE